MHILNSFWMCYHTAIHNIYPTESRYLPPKPTILLFQTVQVALNVGCIAIILSLLFILLLSWTHSLLDNMFCSFCCCLFLLCAGTCLLWTRTSRLTGPRVVRTGSTNFPTWSDGKKDLSYFPSCFLDPFIPPLGGITQYHSHWFMAYAT